MGEGTRQGADDLDRKSVVSSDLGTDNRPRKDRDHPGVSYSVLNITKASTYPRTGWAKALGKVPTISKPKLCQSRTARSFVLTTKLYCMARNPLARARS